MLINAVIISLQITAVYVTFMDGNVLAWLRIGAANILDKIFGSRASRYIQKPLWDCLPCMSSVWTIVLAWPFNWLQDWRLVLAVCGITFILDRIIEYLDVMSDTSLDDFKGIVNGIEWTEDEGLDDEIAAMKEDIEKIKGFLVL